jgi:Na+/phosphate symporter
MPFAGIAFLWFIGVVRDGFGGYEDKFFSSVFIGSGLLFLAMIFVSSAVGAALTHSTGEVADFGRELLLTLSKTYALRMAAVFMISLATIWLKTGLMPRWLVAVTYFVAVVLILATDLTMWLTLAFPTWVLVVSVLLLSRAGVIDLDRDGH